MTKVPIGMQLASPIQHSTQIPTHKQGLLFP